MNAAPLDGLAAKHVGRVPGDYRAACTVCAKPGRDDAVNVTVKDDGNVVAHCHRCNENGTGRPVNGRKRPAARSRPTGITEKYTRLWNSGTEPGEHDYLIRKKVGAHGIRMAGETLLVPRRNAAGEIAGVERIWPDGKKMDAKGSRKEGAYHAIGKPDDCIVIAEGYATRASIFEATGIATAVASGTANLEPVTRALRAKYPTMTLIIAADNDAPGLAAAQEVARAGGGFVAVSTFTPAEVAAWSESHDGMPPTDFKDLALIRGAEAAERAIANADASGACEDQPVDENATAADLEGRAWPDPLAPEAFHGIAGEFVRMIEPVTEADPAAILMQFLVAFGAMVGRAPFFW